MKYTVDEADIIVINAIKTRALKYKSLFSIKNTS